MSQASRARQQDKRRIEHQKGGVFMSARSNHPILFKVICGIILLSMFFYGVARIAKRMKAMNGEQVRHSSVAPQAQAPIAHAKDAVANADFENTENPVWYALKNIQWGGFDIASESLADGRVNHFAKVSAQVASQPMAIKVFGAVQEIDLTKGVPEHWNFDMRVAKEQALCDKQYAQAVAIFWVPKEGAAAKENPEDNVQLRTILHGVKEQPYQMGNAKFHMNPEYQESAGWRHYSLPLRQWFAEAYPGRDFSKGRIRLLMEARYDTMPATAKAGDTALEVNYDNSRFE